MNMKWLSLSFFPSLITLLPDDVSLKVKPALDFFFLNHSPLLVLTMNNIDDDESSETDGSSESPSVESGLLDSVNSSRDVSWNESRGSLSLSSQTS